MIDGFGCNGFHVDRAFGVIGSAGDIHMIRREFTKLLIATYADPVVGTLHEVVPIPAWPNAAANDG